MERVCTVKIAAASGVVPKSFAKDIVCYTVCPDGAGFAAGFNRATKTLMTFKDGKVEKVKKLDCESVNKLEYLVSRSGAVFLVLQSSGRCAFYDEDNLVCAKEFDNVTSVSLGDFWGSGTDQVEIVFADGKRLVTDIGPDPVAPDVSRKTLDATVGALSKQLGSARKALESAYEETGALDDLIEAFCNEINGASQSSYSESDLARKMLGVDRVSQSSSSPSRSSLIPDLMVEWGEVFLVGHNVVLSLNISNVSRGAITSLSFLPNINADPVLIPFVAALDQIDVCPSKSTSAHLFYNIGPLLDLVGESFSVSCLVSYFKGKEKQFHTVPEKRIGLDLAALERNVTFVSDVAALKSSGRVPVSSDTLSSCLMSLGFSYLPGPAVFVHDKNPASVMAQTVAEMKKEGTLALVGKAEQLKMLVRSLYRVMPQDTIVENCSDSKADEEKNALDFASRRSSFLSELSYLSRAFREVVLPQEDAFAKATFGAKQKRFLGSGRNVVSVPSDRYAKMRSELAVLELESDYKLV